MKKILAVFDGFNMSKSTLDYAVQLTKVADAHLVGVFLDEFIYRSYNLVKVMKTYENYGEKMKELDAKDQKKRDAAAQKFQKACNKAGIHFSIHRDKGFAINDLKQESMFADLVVINEFEAFTRNKQESPTWFIKDLLRDVQCPVLVVPNNFKKVDKIVLLYDGGASSLYAVKMFSYLFDSFMEVPVEVVTVKEDAMATSRLPDNKLMREFIKRHFPKASFTVIKGTVENQITGHLRHHKENELVVLGAYRRSEFSRWLKTSLADILMTELDTPLFIAHL
ncbi:universal stress protein [Chryseobacterium sp. MDT2-18]|uniref:universal stress protein n=1 Tax=Chryseobacterium sp. MDT2-18 TaxID=1259136 RepID=UPI0027813404|nr:universal stress protein [Chryseobacterium sp. MDT2-18]MDQ0478133.1 nucleotide-binding universal stress UspA family protein [Chryseobacterium sp. MDT2-18]